MGPPVETPIEARSTRMSAPAGSTVTVTIPRPGNSAATPSGLGSAAGISKSFVIFMNPGASNTAEYFPGLSVTRAGAGRLAGWRLPLIQSSSEVLLSLVPNRTQHVAGPPPPVRQKAQNAPKPAAPASPKSGKHRKKGYGVGDRRALDRLFEATGNGGSGKP